MWLARVAGLNPATSHVILAWDRAGGAGDFALRTALLDACRAERARRAGCGLKRENAEQDPAHPMAV